jgi:hypothetical protein
MASGFITLPNGQDWSSRWSRYDCVLETIMNKLSNEGEEHQLKKWLQYILPNEDNGDIESGYCFYKKTGDKEESFESILRIIDTRFMKIEYPQIFWNTVEELNLRLDKNSDIGFLINQLYESYKWSLTDETKEPKDDETLKEIFLINGFEIAQ